MVMPIGAIDFIADSGQGEFLILRWATISSTFSRSEGSRAVENPESARSVIYAIFSAHIITFRDKKYRILMFRDKTESYLTVCNKTMLRHAKDVRPASLL